MRIGIVRRTNLSLEKEMKSNKKNDETKWEKEKPARVAKSISFAAFHFLSKHETKRMLQAVELSVKVILKHRLI